MEGRRPKPSQRSGNPINLESKWPGPVRGDRWKLDLNPIRVWLGQVSLDTTNVYTKVPGFSLSLTAMARALAGMLQADFGDQAVSIRCSPPPPNLTLHLGQA